MPISTAETTTVVSFDGARVSIAAAPADIAGRGVEEGLAFSFAEPAELIAAGRPSCGGAGPSCQPNRRGHTTPMANPTMATTPTLAHAG